MRLKPNNFSHDHDSVRLCGRCYGWFISEGTHRRFCTSCCSKARRTLGLPWVIQPMDATTSYAAEVGTE